MTKPITFLLLCWMLLLALLAPVHPTRAQFRNPATNKSVLLTRFAFKQYYGGVVVIQARINNIPDTLQFLLDTGSAGISLDTNTCNRLGLTLEPSDVLVRGLADTKTVSFAKNNSLLLPNLKVDSLNFHVNDYELISQVYGIQIDGIIGYSLLNRYIVAIDYDAEEIAIYSKGQFDYPKGGQLFKPSLAQIPIIPAPMRNGKSNTINRYFMDTGAGMCLLLSNQFVKDSSVLSSKKRRNKITQTEAQGIGGKMEMSITTMQEFRIGNYNFRNVPTYLFDDRTNITSYPFLGGMIGNDLLRRFNVVLNYPRKEIHLLPNTHFRDPFDYSYTGLIIYLIHDRIEITDIIKSSPAEKAGFKKGDIIVAISNNFSGNLQVYRELLKNVGSKPIILVMRKGDLLLKKLPIRSIL